MANSQEIRSIKFVEEAKARIDRMKHVAAELTEELGLPAEAKYDVLSEIYGQELILSGVADNTKRDKETELVQRASQGDQDALVKLYETHLDPVYRFIYRRVENVLEAENLTSETFIRAVD